MERLFSYSYNIYLQLSLSITTNPPVLLACVRTFILSFHTRKM